MVKVQHDLIVQYVETNQKEVVSKVKTQQERKEATMKVLVQDKTRSICDELSKRYFLQPDPYILCFELLKEVEYEKKSLVNHWMIMSFKYHIWKELNSATWKFMRRNKL